MDEVGIIGLGRAGTVMAYLLAEKGYRVKIVRSKSLTGREVQVREHRFPVVPMEEIVREAKILLITTPDRVIGEIVEKLCRVDLSPVEGVLHLSGNHPATILKPLQAKGLLIGSLHPLQSLAGLEQGLLNLPGSTFTFEGDPGLLPWITSLVERLEGRLVIAPVSFNKSLYHAGASIASNFLVVLAKMGRDCLVKAGLSPGEAQQGLVSLMEGTLNNLAQLPPDKALTGPIVRNDLVTVSNHLEELKQLSHLLPAYQSLGRLTSVLALEAGYLEETECRQMVEILENGGFNHGKNDSGHLERKKET